LYCEGLFNTKKNNCQGFFSRALKKSFELFDYTDFDLITPILLL
jgi:hypothetical protein